MYCLRKSRCSVQLLTSEFSSQIPNACTYFVPTEGDKKSAASIFGHSLKCPGQFFAANWFLMSKLQMTAVWGNRKGRMLPMGGAPGRRLLLMLNPLCVTTLGCWDFVVS